MLKFYKIDESGYPITGSGKTIPEGFTEFTVEVAENGLITYIPQELQDAMNNLKAKEELDSKIQEAKAYLASTDWYIIRYADNGKEVPSDIKIKREEARVSIGGINE